MSIVYGDHTFCETNTFIPQYSLSNALIDPTVIENFKKNGLLPSDAEIFLPEDDAVKVDWVSPGWFAIHEYPFRIGMSLPFPKLVLDFMRVTGYAPSQFSAMMWRVLLGVDAVCKKHGLSLTIGDLAYQYDVRPNTRGRITFRSRNKSLDLIPSADSTISNSWQDKFFFVRKDSLGDWASVIPEVMEERTTQLAEGDRKLIPSASRSRLQAFLNVDASERVYPVRTPVVVADDDTDQDMTAEDLIVEPDVQITDGAAGSRVVLPARVITVPQISKPVPSGSQVSLRTRSRVGVVDFKPSTSTKIKTSISSDLLKFVDLTMVKGSSSAQSGDVISDESKPDIKPVISSHAPKLEVTDKGKKRKIEDAKPVLGSGSGSTFPDPTAIGEDLIQEFPNPPEALVKLGLSPAETMRYGIGLASQAISVLIAGTKACDHTAAQIDDLKSELIMERSKSLKLSKDLLDKTTRCVDLKTKNDGLEILVDQLLQENGDLKAEREEYIQKEKDVAQYFCQYGKILAMREPVENRVHWDLVAEEAKLAMMSKEDADANPSRPTESSVSPDMDPPDFVQEVVAVDVQMEDQPSDSAAPGQPVGSPPAV